MFIFLLFLYFHSFSSFAFVPLFHLLYCLFYLSSSFLWEMTQNDPQGSTCHVIKPQHSQSIRSQVNSNDPDQFVHTQSLKRCLMYVDMCSEDVLRRNTMYMYFGNNSGITFSIYKKFRFGYSSEWLTESLESNQYFILNLKSI